MNNRIWVLGASDPEMEAIETLLRECGEQVEYAIDDRGERVTAATAYRCPPLKVPAGSTVYAVECVDVLPDGWVRVDHHRPGDPGYGRPPREFLPASSLGQVIAELSRLGRLPMGPRVSPYEWLGKRDEERKAASQWFHWEIEARTAFSGGSLFKEFRAPYSLAPCDGYYILAHRVSGVIEFAASPDERRGEGAVRIAPDKLVRVHIPQELVLAAAADHCLGAAYRGECPGVDPDELMRWRAESRARFQGRSVGEILADIEAARAVLASAPCVSLGDTPVRDLRAVGVVPELPDAATREGVAYLATVSVDGSGRECRPKVVLGGCAAPETVRAFLEDWAPANGLVDLYGDPARGFAGGYLP